MVFSINMHRKFLLGAILIFLVFFVPSAEAEDYPLREELLFMELPVVTSVSKEEQGLNRVASAVYVLGYEDIRRSGVTSFVEALRLVPGLHVARVHGNSWAVTSRGFNEQFAGKLLVLIDGRSVYTPQTAGVEWGRQDIMLENVERIEIIRGPGATIWGANAVNGVINVITKSAYDTQGALVVSGIGTEDRAVFKGRIGDTIGDDTYYRGHFNFKERDGQVDRDGNDTIDDYSMGRGGFRLDSDPDITKSFSLQGEIYRTDADFRAVSVLRDENVDVRLGGGHLMANMEYTVSDFSGFAFQAYFDRVTKDAGDREEKIDTYDFDLHHHARLKRHKLTIGGGYRYVDFYNRIDAPFYYEPGKRKDDVLNFFVQDEIELKSGLLWTIGTKYEHNDYSGAECSPNTRIVWNPEGSFSLWGALSRAVSTPSRADHNFGWLMGPMEFRPSTEIDAEKMTAYEAGLRMSPNPELSLDMTAFYNRHDDIPVSKTTMSGGNVIIEQENAGSGKSYGAELSAKYQPSSVWELNASYSRLHVNLNGGSSSDIEDTERSSPRNQARLRLNIDLPKQFELDTGIYYVGSLKALDIPSYTRVDTRLGWSRNNFNVSLVVQNLLDRAHKEYKTSTSLQEEIERSIYLRLSWAF